MFGNENKKFNASKEVKKKTNLLKEAEKITVDFDDFLNNLFGGKVFSKLSRFNKSGSTPPSLQQEDDDKTGAGDVSQGRILSKSHLSKHTSDDLRYGLSHSKKNVHFSGKLSSISADDLDQISNRSEIIKDKLPNVSSGIAFWESKHDQEPASSTKKSALSKKISSHFEDNKKSSLTYGDCVSSHTCVISSSPVTVSTSPFIESYRRAMSPVSSSDSLSSTPMTSPFSDRKTANMVSTQHVSRPSRDDQFRLAPLNISTKITTIYNIPPLPQFDQSIKQSLTDSSSSSFASVVGQSSTLGNVIYDSSNHVSSQASGKFDKKSYSSKNLSRKDTHNTGQLIDDVLKSLELEEKASSKQTQTNSVTKILSENISSGSQTEVLSGENTLVDETSELLSVRDTIAYFEQRDKLTKSIKGLSAEKFIDPPHVETLNRSKKSDIRVINKKDTSTYVDKVSSSDKSFQVGGKPKLKETTEITIIETVHRKSPALGRSFDSASSFENKLFGGSKLLPIDNTRNLEDEVNSEKNANNFAEDEHPSQSTFVVKETKIIMEQDSSESSDGSEVGSSLKKDDNSSYKRLSDPQEEYYDTSSSFISCDNKSDKHVVLNQIYGLSDKIKCDKSLDIDSDEKSLLSSKEVETKRDEKNYHSSGKKAYLQKPVHSTNIITSEYEPTVPENAHLLATESSVSSESSTTSSSKIVKSTSSQYTMVNETFSVNELCSNSINECQPIIIAEKTGSIEDKELKSTDAIKIKAFGVGHSSNLERNHPSVFIELSGTRVAEDDSNIMSEFGTSEVSNTDSYEIINHISPKVISTIFSRMYRSQFRRRFRNRCCRNQFMCC